MYYTLLHINIDHTDCIQVIEIMRTKYAVCKKILNKIE